MRQPEESNEPTALYPRIQGRSSAPSDGEKGHSVQEVAARLGVSSHSLYEWVKAVRPEKDEQRADELLDAKKEILKLREKGHSVQEVAARLGVSSHSLYEWVKAVRPEKDEQRADELLDAKKEILKLRAELRRVQEERDILKKRREFNQSTQHLH